MVSLFEVGLKYVGADEYSESDFIVFETIEEGKEFITIAAVKVMITSVDEKLLPKLEQICQTYFKKGSEEVTNEDVDKLKDVKKIYEDLLKLQDKNMGVAGTFVEKIDSFTDKNDNEYEIVLKPKKATPSKATSKTSPK
jgi:hypothetical protein